MTPRVPPHDLDAERDLLGAALLTDDARDALLDATTSADFYSDEHARIFAAIADIHAEGAAVTPMTVAVAAGLQKRTLLEIQAASSSSLGAPFLAEKVAEQALLRRMLVIAGELASAAYDSDLNALTTATEALAVVADRPGAAKPAIEAAELAAREWEHDWLVHGLLERGDRLIVSGPEGGGKSLLLRQMAVMLASGVHPFSRVSVRKLRVLIVDLENSEPQIGRSLRGLLSVAGSAYPGSLWVKSRPQGMNLRSPRDARWLDALMIRHVPDVLVLGPLYKAATASGRESKNDETVAEQTAAAIDRLRVKHGCAVLIEAHSPHGEGSDRAGFRPYGASLWLRWPEFGFGLAATKDEQGTVEVKKWRGARERGRSWPKALQPGGLGEWPWLAIESREAS